MKFERVSKYPNAVIPYRATEHSAGYDFIAAEGVYVRPHSISLIPTGIKCWLEPEYYLQLALRSSTPKKKGLMLANGIGIIDAEVI